MNLVKENNGSNLTVLQTIAIISIKFDDTKVFGNKLADEEFTVEIQDKLKKIYEANSNGIRRIKTLSQKIEIQLAGLVRQSSGGVNYSEAARVLEIMLESEAGKNLQFVLEIEEQLSDLKNRVDQNAFIWKDIILVIPGDELSASGKPIPMAKGAVPTTKSHKTLLECFKQALTNLSGRLESQRNFLEEVIEVLATLRQQDSGKLVCASDAESAKNIRTEQEAQRLYSSLHLLASKFLQDEP